MGCIVRAALRKTWICCSAYTFSIIVVMDVVHDAPAKYMAVRVPWISQRLNEKESLVVLEPKATSG